MSNACAYNFNLYFYNISAVYLLSNLVYVLVLDFTSSCLFLNNK